MNWKFGTIFLFHLLLTMFFPDFWNNPNSTSRVLAAHSLVHNGSLKIDDKHELTMDKCLINGHYYSEKAPLPIYMAAGIYFVGVQSGLFSHDDDLRPVYFIGDLMSAAGLAMVITCLFFLLLKYRPPWEAFLLSALPFYGSFVFVFSGTFFSHVISGAMIVLSWIAYNKQKWYVAAVWSGMAFLSEFLLVLIPAVWFLQLLASQKWKPAMQFAVLLLPFGLFMLFYNYVIGTDPFTMLYKYTNNSKELYGLGIPDADVIFELLIPDYRGILFYMPVLIFIGIHFLAQRSFRLKGILRNTVLLPTLVYFLAFSSFHDWWGGWSYGPRQLIPMAMLLVFYAIYKLKDESYHCLLFFGSTMIGLLMALMAKLTVIYSLPTDEKHPLFNIIFQKFLDREFNEQHLIGYLFGSGALVSILIWLMLLFGLTFLLRFYPHIIQTSYQHE